MKSNAEDVSAWVPGVAVALGVVVVLLLAALIVIIIVYCRTTSINYDCT